VQQYEIIIGNGLSNGLSTASALSSNPLFTSAPSAVLASPERRGQSPIVEGGETGPEGETSKETDAEGTGNQANPRGDPDRKEPGSWPEATGGGATRSRATKRRHLQRRSDQDLGERAKFGATRASPSLSFWSTPRSAKFLPDLGLAEVGL